LKRKKLLEDEYDKLTYKLNCEFSWFRNEIKPIKDRQREILEELKEFKDY
tara:strand:- start:157 stop:306 length:150 start_codon:yes stop_codon:yes gene_type:complete